MHTKFYRLSYGGPPSGPTHWYAQLQQCRPTAQALASRGHDVHIEEFRVKGPDTVVLLAMLTGTDLADLTTSLPQYFSMSIYETWSPDEQIPMPGEDELYSVRCERSRVAEEKPKKKTARKRKGATK